MPLSFMTDSVTVIRPGTRTSRGSAVPDWTVTTTTTGSGATEHVVADVQVTSESTAETRDGRVDNVSDRMRLRARYDADIRSGDRVVWNGDVYEVDGDVVKTKSPSGRVSSTRCRLALWRG